MREKINLEQKLNLFEELWSPKIIAELNGQQVKIAKVQGEFVWHRHEAEDELFLVLDGRLTIRLRDGEVVLEPGEMYIVPRGVEHQPYAEHQTAILMFEPASTLNTGNIRSERTKETLETL